jgi:vancomycin resistance protein YoaR
MTTKKQLKAPVKKLSSWGWLSLFGLTAVVLAWASYELAYRERIYPRIFIQNQEVSGQTKQQAVRQLQTLVRQKVVSRMVWRYQTEQVVIPLSAIDQQYLIEDTVSQAYSLGRSNQNLIDLVQRLNLIAKPKYLSLPVYFNEEKLASLLATISAQITKPIIPPSLSILTGDGQKKVVVEPGQNGQEIDWPVLRKIVQTSNQQFTEINNDIPIKNLNVTLSNDQLENLRQQAENLLNKKTVLTYENQQWEIDDQQMISLLDFDSQLEKSKIASFTAFLAQSIDRPAENALFEFENQQVKQFKPAINGLALNQKQSQQLLAQAINDLQQSTRPEIKIALPVEISLPQISTADSNSFGINTLLGKGESWFSHSIASRIYNVGLASAKFHGRLIPPGEQLFFNQTVGDISMQSGYKQAYIIKEGRTVLGDGGGVCQVSTTLFRAALKSGLEIVERTAHAYRVSYYEERSAVGLDATVFDPRPDFVFKNNTDNYILIQRVFNPDTVYLAFEIYGKPDGRQIYLSESRLWDQSPPPPDRYQDDPTLPLGVIKQVDWSAWGAKAAFDYKVILHDQVLQEKTFYSTYRPWQAIFLKGTKTD